MYLSVCCQPTNSCVNVNITAYRDAATTPWIQKK